MIAQRFADTVGELLARSLQGTRYHFVVVVWADDAAEVGTSTDVPAELVPEALRALRGHEARPVADRILAAELGNHYEIELGRELESPLADLQEAG